MEYHQLPLVVSTPVSARPIGRLSGSVTLLVPPPPIRSTRLETRGPTAPDGGGASSVSAVSTGEMEASSEGASFTAVTGEMVDVAATVLSCVPSFTAQEM